MWPKTCSKNVSIMIGSIAWDMSTSHQRKRAAPMLRADVQHSSTLGRFSAVSADVGVQTILLAVAPAWLASIWDC